jgi:hypothetical protein
VQMHKEKYEELLRRFSQELHEVGVTGGLRDLITDQCDRTPNAASATADEVTDRFTYRHEGYMVEAVRMVKLVVKKCK